MTRTLHVLYYQRSNITQKIDEMGCFRTLTDLKFFYRR